MKRMNVREFRAKISELNNEPIEVVRYSETVGFWVPIALTTEPAKKPKLRARKIEPTISIKATGDAEIDTWLAKLKKMNEEMKKLTVT